jgi:hypothetical protein
MTDPSDDDLIMPIRFQARRLKNKKRRKNDKSKKNQIQLIRYLLYYVIKNICKTT